jgi:hypothetical protein
MKPIQEIMIAAYKEDAGDGVTVTKRWEVPNSKLMESGVIRLNKVIAVMTLTCANLKKNVLMNVELTVDL